MLSAFAARKAAALANSTSEIIISENTSLSSKRKSFSSEPNTSTSVRKKARVKDREVKQKKVPKKRAKAKGPPPLKRYFLAPGQDSFSQGHNIDSNSDSESSGVFIPRLQDEILSSEDTPDDDVTPVDVNLSTFFPHTAQQQPKQQSREFLSSFKPITDENIFLLSVEDLACLKLPSCSSSSLTHTPPPSSLVLLSPHESICILGTCTITVLHGSISVLGTTIFSSTQSHRIYAPRSFPLPIIRCSYTKTRGTLSNVNFPRRFAIDEDVARHAAVILFQELKTGVEGLGNICRPFLNMFEPSKWQSRERPVNPFHFSGLSMVYEQLSDIQPFVLPPTWTKALDEVLNSPEAHEVCGIYLVKGPKNAGKSTFSRTLMNRLLETYERVAFLECDLGQSEFTPGGMVALNIISRPVFGPPFTHPTLPVCAHYIGSSTPRSYPSRYLEAVQALLQVYRLEIQKPSDERLDHPSLSDYTNEIKATKIAHTIPLIINTMGWTKGLGADLTFKIEEWAAPTDVFIFDPAPAAALGAPPIEISGSRRGENAYGAFHRAGLGMGVGGMGGDHSIARNHFLDGPVGAGKEGITAANWRTLSILSYFHCVFPTWSFSSSLSSTPFSSPLSTFLPLSLSHRLSLGQVTAESWNTSLPLVAMRPYEVDCSRALDAIVLVGSGGEDVVSGEVGRVVNGAVVGLVCCGLEGSDIDGNMYESIGEGGGAEGGGRERKMKMPYKQHRPIPSPAVSTCIGLALIRGVSPRLMEGGATISSSSPSTWSQTKYEYDIQLLAPLPPELLSITRVLVKGEMELPIWGMLDFRSWDGVEGIREELGEGKGVVQMEQGRTPYLQWGKNVAGAVGAEKRRVRRNLMRRGQA